MTEKRAPLALVTGANRGIGFQVCRQLAQHGFQVLLTARDAAKANKAAMQLSTDGHIEPLVLDVADPRSIKQAAEEVGGRYRQLNVLINNAGINYDTWQTAENADIDATVMETITTNLLGPWRMCQAFLPLLRKSKSGADRQCVLRIRIARAHGRWSACVSGNKSRTERADTHVGW